MEGIIGGPHTGTNVQSTPSRRGSKRSPYKQNIAEHPVDDLMVNCRDAKKPPVRPANNYKITEVDAGQRITDLESPGNGSAPTNRGSLVSGVCESDRGRAEPAKQEKSLRAGVNASDSSENRWQKFFDTDPEYSKKDKKKLKPDLFKKLSSLEKKNKAEYWKPVVGKEASSDRVAMLLKAIRECQELFELLDGRHSNCPDNIKRYVKLLWVKFGVYHLDECLKSGLPDYQLSFMTSIKDAAEYRGLLHVLAKHSVCGSSIVPMSRHIQFFCYYKAADAGCEKAKILLIKEMLFCRISGGEKDALECQLFCPREALTFLSTLSRRKASAASQALTDYDQIIDGLVVLVDKKDAKNRDKLARELITDERHEVKGLVPMLFLEKSFGEVDHERALEFINKLSEIPVLKYMCDYWLCQYYFVDGDGKEKVEGVCEKVIALVVKNMPSMFDIYLDCFLYHELEEPLPLGFFNLPYLQIHNPNFLLQRDLAHRMVMASYVLDKMDCLRNDAAVSMAKKKARIVSVIYGHPDAVADKLYDESLGFFSMDHWQKSGLGERMSTPDGFLKTMDEFAFSRDPVIGIFRKANQAITSGSFSISQNDADFEWGSIKTAYWLLVLSFLPKKDVGFVDLVNKFLSRLAFDEKGWGHVKPFFHRSSIGGFVQKLYRYYDYSNELKDHSLFIPENIELFGLNEKDYDFCLRRLLTIKALHNCSHQVVGYKYDLSADQKVIKAALSEDNRIFLKVVVQERHPVGDVYQYNQVMSILERIEANDGFVFHVDVFVFLLGFVDDSKYCLDRVWLINIFDGCLRVVRRIKMMMLGFLNSYCQKVCEFKSLPGVKTDPANSGQFSQIIKSLDRIKINLAKSGQVDDYKINFGDGLLGSYDYYKSFIEHNLLSRLRSFDGDDEVFFKYVKKLADSLPDGSVDKLSLADVFFVQSERRRCVGFECLLIIAYGINGFFEKQLNLEFDMMLVLLESMRESLDRPAGKVLTGTINIELQYYSLLAEMALRGRDVLARFFNESENDFFSQVAVAISGNDDQIEIKLMETTDAEGDIPRRFRAHSRVSKNTESVQGSMAEAGMAEAGSEQLAKGDESACDASECISTMPEGDRATLNEQICELISKKSQKPEIQSELLWIGYESAVLSKADCLDQLRSFNKESKEYFFYSVLLEDRADHSVFISLQNNKNLYSLKRPQLEAISLKLVEIGRIKDAFWLADKFNLNWLGGMLSWHHDKSKSLDEKSNEIPVMLIHGAEAGINMAQCRLVDWVLHQKKGVMKEKELANKDDEQIGEKMTNAVSVQSGCDVSFDYSAVRRCRIEAQCCFYIHLPCIWSDSQRILYQGVALCTGIHGHQDEEKGITEIKEALTSDDPCVPFILYWLQTSSLMEKEYFSNKGLLMAFAGRIPGSPGRLLTKLIVNFGESAVSQVASDMNGITGVTEENREVLQEQSEVIQAWLCQWREQSRMGRLSPAEKLIYHFGAEAREGWPVQNHAALQDEVKRLSESHLRSDILQSALISAVKSLNHFSRAYKDFAGFLYNFIAFRNRHRLLMDEDGEKALSLDSQVFEQNKRLPLFRAVPEKQRQIMLESLVADINPVDERTKVDSSHILARLVEELVDEIKNKDINLTQAALARNIQAVSQRTGKKKYKFSEMLQYLCSIDSSGPGADHKAAFRKEVKRRAVDSFKNPIDFGKETEGELLSKIAIYILT